MPPHDPTARGRAGILRLAHLLRALPLLCLPLLCLALAPHPALAQDPVQGSLLELALARFPDLNEHERKLVHRVQVGQSCVFETPPETDADTLDAFYAREDMPEIRAELLAWLLGDKQARDRMQAPHKGLWLAGARIVSRLVINFVDFPFPLVLDFCHLPHGLEAINAKLGLLQMRASRVGGIMAPGIEVANEMTLVDGFQAEGVVFLIRANIGGQLDCTGARFFNPDGVALSADLIKVSDGVLLPNVQVKGEVSFTSAEIGGGLYCKNGQFTNPGGKTLDAERLKVSGDVRLDDTSVTGKMILNMADIQGHLICSGAKFTNSDGDALAADMVSVAGLVLFDNNFKAEGNVRLAGSVIGGQLICSGAQFTKSNNDDALTIYGAKVAIDVLLDNIQAEGRVSLAGAEIGGGLSCSNGRFMNPGGDALTAEWLKVSGSAHFDGQFQAEGEVRLFGAIIGEQLVCKGGQFTNPHGTALNAHGMRIAGSVFLDDGFQPQGLVDFGKAVLGSKLQMADWQSHEDVTLDLSHARVQTLSDTPNAWPVKGKLFLDGFTYEAIDEKAPRTAKERLDWLDRQPDNRFRAQPYEQLASVLRMYGQEQDARDVLIAKNDKLLHIYVQAQKDNALDELAPYRLGWWKYNWFRFTMWLHRTFMDYGYSKWQLVVSLIAWLGAGAFIFWRAYRIDLLVKIQQYRFRNWSTGCSSVAPVDYPGFSPVKYAIDCLIPFVDLGQARYWQPATKSEKHPIRCWFLGWFFVLYVPVGWILATLTIAVLSGMFKH